MFFELDFTMREFTFVDNIQAIIHAPDLKPRGNKAFPVAFSRTSSTVPMIGRNITLRDDFFTLSFSKFVNILLEKPYSTNCKNYRDDEHESQEQCIDACVTRETVNFKHKAPFTAIQTEPLDILHVSVSDNEDEGFAMRMTELKSKCWSQCSQPNCYDEIYVTKFIRSESFQTLAFRVYVANEPTMQSTFKPKLR